jgi:hypothetical protein
MPPWYCATARAQVPASKRCCICPPRKSFRPAADPRYAALQANLLVSAPTTEYFYNRPATPYLDWTYRKS